MRYFDKFEIRSADERAADLAQILPAQVRRAKSTTSAEIDPADIKSIGDLKKLPVFRKSELGRVQSNDPPFGGLVPDGLERMDYVFQSPGPIYEPGRNSPDWWRMGRFLHACGIGSCDIVQNCFSYHFTPAGMIFENGARAVGATVFPAGTGGTDMQARAAAEIGVTAYAGTPDYLKVILEKADEFGLDLSRITKAAVGGGALFPSLRAEYDRRGIACLQCYATADVGNIAYETIPDGGLIVDEGVAVEIVTPGTGDPVEPGMVGEVLVTTLNPDYPLIRFATGDLSALIPGTSGCGRTNVRLAGWKGRADQTTKIKGMFVGPSQVAEFVRLHPPVERARIVVTRTGEMDQMAIRVESRELAGEMLEQSVRDLFKLNGSVEVVAPGTLPNDGKVIDDLREYD